MTVSLDVLGEGGSALGLQLTDESSPLFEPGQEDVFFFPAAALGRAREVRVHQEVKG